MPKKIPCACAQGYHYSKTEKTNCRRINGFLVQSVSATPNYLQLQFIDAKPHHHDCPCEKCEQIRVQKLIFFFKPSFNRIKLQSQSDISENQLTNVEISKMRPNKNEVLVSLWDENKIGKLMTIGVGNIHLSYFEAIKSERRRMRRNQTFLRMYLFLNPQISIIMTGWNEIVRPKQLMLQVEHQIDTRSYRQRIEDRLDALAKRYKRLHMNSITYHFTTLQMKEIEEKTDYLTQIVQKFTFIEEFQDLIARKQQQKWERNIVFLKKGEYHPHMIRKFSDLIAVAPFFQPPTWKKSNLSLISQKSHLDRKYEQVRREAKYHGLIQNSSFVKNQQLLIEISSKKEIFNQEKMEIELSFKNSIVNNAQKMDIQQPKFRFDEKSFNNSLTVAFKRQKPKPFYGRSYLFPMVMAQGSSKPMSMEQIYNSVARCLSTLDEKDDWSTEQKYQPRTQSKEVTSTIAFSQLKSRSQAQWIHQEPMSSARYIFRQLKPQSDLTIYTLADMNQFPLQKGKKQFQPIDFQRCSRPTCQKWLFGSVLECEVCSALFHNQCWVNVNFCFVCRSTNMYLNLRFDTVFDDQRFSQMSKILTPPSQPLFPEETLTAIKQIEQNLSKQAYCVINCFHERFIVYPFYNSQLKRLHTADQIIIDQFESKKMAFPVIIKEINSTKGRGLVARRPISKGELVATYSGNVVSLAQVAKHRDVSIKDYLFHLISGPDVQTNFVVFPKDFASAGFFMNHADSRTNKKKINVKTLIALHRNGPIVLMQANKKINYGEELMYDYNGEYDAFDTQGFE